MMTEIKYPHFTVNYEIFLEPTPYLEFEYTSEFPLHYEFVAGVLYERLKYRRFKIGKIEGAVTKSRGFGIMIFLRE